MPKNEEIDLLTKAKDLLKSEVTQISFQTWIKDLEIESIENNTITLIAPDDVHKETINSRYYNLITNTFKF